MSEIDDIRNMRLSNATKRSYGYLLARFIGWVMENPQHCNLVDSDETLDLEKLDAEVFLEFILTLKKEKKTNDGDKVYVNLSYEALAVRRSVSKGRIIDQPLPRDIVLH